MSWNTWLASMTKMENLRDSTLLKMRDKLRHMMDVYMENVDGRGGELLARMSMRELDKCQEQMDRVKAEIQRRGLY